MKRFNKWHTLVAGIVFGASAFMGIKAAAADQLTQLKITSNTQAEVDDLRIAAYNFRDENGPSCAIQVSVRDDSSKDQKLRVHKGDTFKASNKSFTVADVAGKTVVLDVK